MKIKDKNLEELKDIAKEIRELLIDVVSKNGGHLASNLGVVELTIALHYIFNSPEDIMLWDVGHQAYVHKILTGREERFPTIRKKGGLTPFTNPNESIHDGFISGHAGNTLSAALGIHEAKKNNKVIAIIGDAALANGESLEAINNISEKDKNLIIVLNDNEHSIGENVGALSKYMSKIMGKKSYNDFKNEVELLVRKVIFGNSVADFIKRLEHTVKYFFNPGNFFEELGIHYIGPVDGHNLKELISTFEDVKDMEGPVIVHIKTEKGKGYKFAEQNREKFHGISPFDIKTGETCKKNESYSQLFGNKLVELGEKNSEIIAITAGMIKGTGLDKFFEKYPKRSYDVGIAEMHAVTFAGGLAIKGKKPVVAIYSTFLQRAYDQLIHDIALQNLPVLFILDRAGIVGEDGPTHNGIFDIAYLQSIPNIRIMAPFSKEDLEKSLEFAVNDKSGPIAIRIPRDSSFCLNVGFEYGKWQEIKKGNEYLVIAVGSMLKELLIIEKELNKNNVYPTIVGVNFINPLDEKYILENFVKYEKIFILEEGILHGGFSSKILEFLNDKNINKIIHRIGIEGFVEHGKRDEILTDLGLKGKKLVDRLLKK
ncbi:1-deoxy-D-xylulose-5-phosphate synthase [Haliovirga abyssi]|uniref:1-deoxy-D-xylulose-5-phosphate synthase n=1 Tax=Haliovirga abyssi TaxID=2996794 RepID=A0AAU9DSB7_9FUSO|nr:1-deoxy-D-xylulose-5-phosphate synthase [Haliovirga abyssi]BDU49899.1 1-deoxy-D-xylulose-5-phosphate synthase [Haliovirga abyssi]